MWKKPDPPESQPEPSPPVRDLREPSRERATIGPSISLKGDLTGEEDLLIQGQIEGKVDLGQYSVTVGKKGRVKADIYGNTINVEGEVHGHLYGVERIIIRQTGKVLGNLVAPRVTLEDGSRFKGSIDMDAKGAERARPAVQKTPAAPQPAAGEKEEKEKESEQPRKVGLGLKLDSGSARP